MSNRMTAAEYRKQFVEPVLKEEAEDDEFFKKVVEIDRKNKTAKNIVRGKNAMVSNRDSIPRSTKKKTAKPKKPRVMEEDNLTIQITDYLEVLKAQGKVLMFSHIPSSTFTTSWSVKSRNTAMGVRAGVPDMLIIFPNKVLFLELKRLKGGVVSPFQKEWIGAINKVDNLRLYSSPRVVEAVVAAGWDAAKEVIDNSLG